MENTIRSIEDLKREKEKLKIKMEVAEHAFFQSLHQSQQLTKSYLWSRVKLPALVVGTAVKGTQQLLSNSEASSQDSNGQHWLKMALPIAQSLLASVLDTDA